MITEAEAALERGPYSVADKTTLPPGGNIRDYFHPAPYFWPNPNTHNGLPYVMRDGVRVPGTRMYDPESDRYDRTRLQRLFDDSRILTLAWKTSRNRRYIEHAKTILIRFFVDPDARMTRHLKYAQVRMGHNKNMGSPTGLIEMKDLYFYLDAVRLLLHAGMLNDREIRELRSWFASYLNWLIKSRQGVAECAARNNHGLYYDLQVVSIAALLGETLTLRKAFDRAIIRFQQHFAGDGSQPHELTRETSQHYCCFNLQGWINLAELAKRQGYDVWAYRAPNGATLPIAVRWLLSLSRGGGDWPHRQIEPFDRDRLLPIWFAAASNGVEAEPVGEVTDNAQVKPIFHPHDGIKPFWQFP